MGVYSDIEARLLGFNPKIELKTWVKRVIKVHPDTLGGVDFEPTDYNKLLDFLDTVKDDYGEKAFVSDRIKDPMTGEVVVHKPLRASFAKTEGAGLREIYRIRLSDRPLMESDARTGLSMDRRFSGLFGPNASQMTLSSIHWDVGKLKTNVHIDTTGFTMSAPGMGVFLTPDAPQHIVNDLWIKTNLAGYGGILGKIAERVSVLVPTWSTGYDWRVGIGVDVLQGKTYKLTVMHTCHLYTDKVCYWGGDWTIAAALSGTTDIGGGGR